MGGSQRSKGLVAVGWERGRLVIGLLSASSEFGRDAARPRMHFGKVVFEAGQIA
jgi:hypothetical protein